MTLPEEIVSVLRDLNPWWRDPPVVRPVPPRYRRRAIQAIESRLLGRGRLVEVLRGPRQVGKTTGLYQIIQSLIRKPRLARRILFVRFDLELLRQTPGGLLAIFRWFTTETMGGPRRKGPGPFVFLDEIHKLPRWEESIKHLVDTFDVRLVLTGSSSVLVAKGGRESLAGRVFSTEIPTFTFREAVEAWKPNLARALPEALRFEDAFEPAFFETCKEIHQLQSQRRLALKRYLERYFNRGGYPRLLSGEIDDDIWADYLVQTVFENVLGADIPDLFPVQDPRLLRQLYLMVARRTGNEVSQPSLVDEAKAAGFETTQPTVGKYLHYLADALLIREFRRYPLAKKRTSRVPLKMTLSDLGVSHAIVRGAPSLWESDPTLLGPKVETVVQSVIRGPNLQTHFFRDYEIPGNRKSPIAEVDFVAERIDGTVLPLEVKFRRRIDRTDVRGLELFLDRFDAPHGLLVTRDRFEAEPRNGVFYLPLLDFLLTF